MKNKLSKYHQFFLYHKISRIIVGLIENTSVMIGKYIFQCSYCELLSKSLFLAEYDTIHTLNYNRVMQ